MSSRTDSSSSHAWRATPADGSRRRVDGGGREPGERQQVVAVRSRGRRSVARAARPRSPSRWAASARRPPGAGRWSRARRRPPAATASPAAAGGGPGAPAWPPRWRRAAAARPARCRRRRTRSLARPPRARCPGTSLACVERRGVRLRRLRGRRVLREDGRLGVAWRLRPGDVAGVGRVERDPAVPLEEHLGPGVRVGRGHGVGVARARVVARAGSRPPPGVGYRIDRARMANADAYCSALPGSALRPDERALDRAVGVPGPRLRRRTGALAEHLLQAAQLRPRRDPVALGGARLGPAPRRARRAARVSRAGTVGGAGRVDVGLPGHVAPSGCTRRRPPRRRPSTPAPASRCPRRSPPSCPRRVRGWPTTGRYGLRPVSTAMSSVTTSEPAVGGGGCGSWLPARTNVPDWLQRAPSNESSAASRIRSTGALLDPWTVTR